MPTTSEYKSKLDGGPSQIVPPMNESTPLLGSNSECQFTAGSSSLRNYDASESSLRNSIGHCKTSERDNDEDHIYCGSGSSSHKDKSPDRYPSKQIISHATLDNDSETCQNTLGIPYPSYSRFTLPEGVSLRLENSGSVARDHLASERTFLAYMRTSLAIASSGVALVQLFSVASAPTPQGSVHRLQAYIRPLGASTILVGLLVLFIGVTRYFTVQNALTKGYFPVARIATGFIAVVLTALVTVTFAITLAGKLEFRQT